MGKLLGISLISGGLVMLFNIFIMAIGGMELMFGLFLPVMLKLAPLNQQLRAWVEVPLAISMNAEFLDVRTFKEDGIIGGGMIDFYVHMSGGGPDSEGIEAVPAIYIQEEMEISDIQRYYINAGPLNYPSIFCWLVALGSLGAMIAAIIFRFIGGKKSTEEIERGSSAGSVTVTQVIAVEDTAFKD